RDTWGMMLEAIRAVEDTESSPREQLRKTAAIVLRTWRNDPDLVRVLVREVTRRGEQLQREVGEIALAFEALQRIVTRGQEAAVLVSSAFGPAAAHAAGVATTWCGGANLAQTDRKPDLLSGNQIDVIYAHAADAPDHFAQLASPIATDVAAVDAWWRKQDPTR